MAFCAMVPLAREGVEGPEEDARAGRLGKDLSLVRGAGVEHDYVLAAGDRGEAGWKRLFLIKCQYDRSSTFKLGNVAASGAAESRIYWMEQKKHSHHASTTAALPNGNSTQAYADTKARPMNRK